MNASVPASANRLQWICTGICIDASVNHRTSGQVRGLCSRGKSLATYSKYDIFFVLEEEKPMKILKSVAAALVLSASLAGSALAEGKVHHVAFHVNENDPQVMNIALNNVANLRQYYIEQGDELIAEVVTYGPGLQMLTEAAR